MEKEHYKIIAECIKQTRLIGGHHVTITVLRDILIARFTAIDNEFIPSEFVKQCNP